MAQAGHDMIERAGSFAVGDLLTLRARRHPDFIAVVDGARSYSYFALNARANQLANALAAMGIVRGDRIAILSENRAEYIEATYAAAKLGIILAALNWRLARNELSHCISLVAPKIVLVSARFAGALQEADWRGPAISIGDEYEALLAQSVDDEPSVAVDPEDGLLILYTSGTTGLPKGALISHRAELARMDLSRIDLGLVEGDGFIAWAPMFHMVSLEHALHVLGLGGKVFVVDGADPVRIAELVATEPQWWLVLIPGMIDPLLDEMKRRKIVAKGIRLIGALADLIPPQTLAEASRLLGAPYWNTFGSTETGMLPAAGTRFATGEVPSDLSKAHNSLYLWRLVDADDRDVARGEAGEIAVRGPTVFSGYWNADEANAQAFRGGWYHMGDMFLERADGKLSFVDRSKYLIKSGGENIYPIEIERVLMADPAVVEAVVVRRPDPQWGEVPVAFVVCQTDVTTDYLIQVCRRDLSTYKCPREIRLLKSQDEFPRSTSGKVQRQLVEQWLK
ncbi:MAG: class I adenylate-forming enzyme family protein [Bradyrhizobium sp.]